MVGAVAKKQDNFIYPLKTWNGTWSTRAMFLIYVDGTVKNHTFIHPSLVGSLVIWLDPRYNYYICKLMQAIIRNSAIEMKYLEKKKKNTHYLTVYEISDTKLGPLKRYKVYKRDSRNIPNWK